MRRLELDEAELNACMEYQGNSSQLRLLDQLLLSIAHVPRAREKVRALSSARGAPPALDAASKEYEFLTKVLRSIRESKTIGNVLRLSLHFNNFVNNGTARVYRGLKISSVEKLSRMKGNADDADGNDRPAMKTALHFLVKLAASSSTNIDIDQELKFKELIAAASLDVAAIDSAVSEAALNLRAAKRETDAWQQAVESAGLSQLVAALDGPCTRKLEIAREKRQELRSAMWDAASWYGEVQLPANASSGFIRSHP